MKIRVVRVKKVLECCEGGEGCEGEDGGEVGDTTNDDDDSNEDDRELRKDRLLSSRGTFLIHLATVAGLVPWREASAEVFHPLGGS